MADETLDSRAQALFERNPLVGMLAIVVAGNALPGARVIDIEGKDVMLPDWGADEWAWWLRTCIGLSRAMEDEKPEGTKPDKELGKLYQAATGMLNADGGLRSDLATIEGDEIGWLRFVGPILIAGGRLVGRQAVRAGKWAAPYAKKAAVASWGFVSKSFKTAPFKTTAGVALLAAPDTAVRVVKTAGTMAGSLFGSAAGALVKTAGPIGLIVIGVIAYFALKDHF